MFPMKLIEDYKILNFDDKNKLEDQIKKHLSKGWTILGACQVVSHKAQLNYTQVMIKVAEQ